ncbi:MAG: glycosyl hydrolase [Proteobacteria bacterium]|nr:glycosyl hydrolase [Pseudomonadota bacterium]
MALRVLLAVLWAAAAPAAGHAEPAPALVAAVPAAAFLDSIGVNLHVAQGNDPASYVGPLRYTGVRQARDGMGAAAGLIALHRQTGVRFSLIADGDLQAVLAEARLLAQADALLALEGPNEPNNFPIRYGGATGGGPGGRWEPVAALQRDLYAAAKADPLLRRYPVFGVSEAGAQTGNMGLQFLTIPAGAGTAFPAGTVFADYVNVHNYVIGNGGHYDDNQAWNAADPTLRGRWDGLYDNHGLTWHRSFLGYSAAELVSLPRVTTETGWDSTEDPGGEHTQGAILTDTYLAQFKRGWAYTFVYEMFDQQGSVGDHGLYHGDAPKRSAVYLHNLTTLLAGEGNGGDPGALAYEIPGQPDTVHDLLLRKADGRFALVVWGERRRGADTVTVRLDGPRAEIRVYDITRGTEPVQVLHDTDRVPLTLTDHAVILDIPG